MITNLIQVFEDTVKKYPNNIALSDEHSEITYKAYMHSAKTIGAYLESKVQASNQPIMVLVGRNIESIIMFMGVLYSGNIYVPVDENIPSDRLEIMIETVQPQFIIGLKSQLEKFGSIDSIDKLVYEAAQPGHVSGYKQLIDQDPAYIIFTSGSTGKPKGIAVSHSNILDLMDWLVETFDFTHQDALGNQTPFYFDASVKDIYIALKTGASLHIIPQKFFMFPVKLIDHLNEKKITIILWATSALNLVAKSKILDKRQPHFLKRIFFAGEAMYGKTLNIWQSHINADYINLYGPTEATVDATYYVVSDDFEDDQPVPIGKACENMQVFIHDANEDGVGELLIRGKAVALGYYNDPERSQAVFVQNPNHNLFRDIVYKTGDLVKYNEDGDLIFVARKDHQVKHKGYRIELGDIEMVALSHEQVLEAVCLYDGQQLILVYSGQVENMRQFLLKKLPKYMIPEKIVTLESLPHNANSKIDRKALEKEYCEAI